MRESGAEGREGPLRLHLGDGPAQRQSIERPGQQMRRRSHGVGNRHYRFFVSIVNTSAHDRIRTTDAAATASRLFRP